MTHAQRTWALAPLLAIAAVPCAGGTWTARAVKDELTGRTSRHSFSLVSTNAVTFSFPYGGPHRATLYYFLETSGAVSLAVAVRGQILHDNGAKVVVDSKEPFEISLGQADDHDVGFAFLQGVSATDVAAAGALKIGLSFYQSGTHVFRFTAVQPLEKVPTYARRFSEVETAATAKAQKAGDEQQRRQAAALTAGLDRACKQGAEYLDQAIGLQTALDAAKASVGEIDKRAPCLAEIAADSASASVNAARLLAATGNIAHLTSLDAACAAATVHQKKAKCDAAAQLRASAGAR